MLLQYVHSTPVRGLQPALREFRPAVETSLYSSAGRWLTPGRLYPHRGLADGSRDGLHRRLVGPLSVGALATAKARDVQGEGVGKGAYLMMCHEYQSSVGSVRFLLPFVM